MKNNTAYRARGYIQVAIIVDDVLNQTLRDVGDSFARGMRETWIASSGYTEKGGTIYINYAHGDESLETRYGASKLPRLAKLKKWDPSNVFAYSNALPISYP